MSSLPAPSGWRVTCNRSGSKAEGLDIGIIGEKSTLDFDIMLEFDGPNSAGRRRARSRPTSSRALSRSCGPGRPAGFVTLHWVRTKQCSHEESLDGLPVDSFRHVTHDFYQVSSGNMVRPPPPGPDGYRQLRSGDKCEGTGPFSTCLCKGCVHKLSVYARVHGCTWRAPVGADRLGGQRDVASRRRVARTCFTIHPEPEEVWETVVVAPLAEAARGAQSRQTTLH